MGISLYSWNIAYSYYGYLPYPKTQIIIKNTVIGTYMATTEVDQKQGLSNKKILPSGMSMLFVFDNEDRHGMWMKDMNFPLDMIWIDKYKKIIHQVSNISPSTYPHVFYPDTNDKYVLELPAGFIENQKLKEGDQIYFEI